MVQACGIPRRLPKTIYFNILLYERLNTYIILEHSTATIEPLIYYPRRGTRPFKKKLIWSYE